MSDRKREYMDCRHCDKLGYHSREAGCILAVEAAAAVNGGLVPQEVLAHGLPDWSDLLAQAAASEELRTKYEVAESTVIGRIKAVMDFTLVIEPMVMAHFQHLVMDTEEDEALRRLALETLQPWHEAVQDFREWKAAR